MNVITVPFGPLGSNMYIISCADGYIVIDPSVSPDDTLKYRDLPSDFKSRIVAVLMTHAHFDHCSCLDSWAELTSELYISREDVEILRKPRHNCSFLFDTPLEIKAEVKPLLDVMELSDLRCRVISTPGHTPGSVCFLFERERIMFTGDTLFAGSVGRSDLPLGSPRNLMKSVQKLMTLPESIVCYPGHGYHTTIALEKERNPYI